MKNIFTLLFLITAMCSFAGAQTPFPEFEIAKEIKLLRSTKSDVKLIMSEFDREDDDKDNEYFGQEFRSDNAKVLVSYSTGDCSEDAGIQNHPEWNIPKMTATKVVITFDETVKLKDLGLNLSSFKKKLEDEEVKDSEEYIYYDENAGIIILTDEGEVGKIILHPPKKQIGSLCRNENNSEILSKETDLVDSIVSSISACNWMNMPSLVSNLELQTKGVFGCKDGKCLDAKKEISVTTTAVDIENDQLLYNYDVSGGKIIGSGANVVWDLADVAPGIYSITAGADDGSGISGETKSQRILVKENSYEIIPPAKMKELILDKTELIAACPVGRLKRVSCPLGSCEVSITSIAAEDKSLIYKYKTFHGEIIGSGDKVVWDLAGLRPGEYSVEVSASTDGVGFGEPKTATVIIKENSACSAPKKD